MKSKIIVILSVIICICVTLVNVYVYKQNEVPKVSAYDREKYIGRDFSIGHTSEIQCVIYANFIELTEYQYGTAIDSEKSMTRHVYIETEEENVDRLRTQLKEAKDSSDIYNENSDVYYILSTLLNLEAFAEANELARVEMEDGMICTVYDDNRITINVDSSHPSSAISVRGNKTDVDALVAILEAYNTIPADNTDKEYLGVILNADLYRMLTEEKISVDISKYKDWVGQ